MTYRSRVASAALVAAVTACPLIAAGEEPPVDRGAAASTAAAATQPDLAEFVRHVQQEFNDAQRRAAQAADAGKTPAEQQKIYNEQAPRPAEYARRVLAKVQQAPDGPGALEALQFVFRLTREGDPQLEPLYRQAVALVLDHQVNNPEIGTLFARLRWYPSPAAEDLMRQVLSKTSNAQVRAKSAFGLAQYLRTQSEGVAAAKEDPAVARRIAQLMGAPAAAAFIARDPEQMNREAESLLASVIADDAGAKRSDQQPLAESAKHALFALQHLAVGKAAPEIAAADQDGHPMKLSDFRGKVVVLDFWGDW